MSREKRLARGGHGPKTPQKGVFCGPGPPLAKPCVSASSPSGAGADPDCRSLRLLCSLRSPRSRHARTFRPCGAQAPRYRDRQSASSTPTRSSLRSLCGPAISRSLWPGRWAACGGLSANASGEYLRRICACIVPSGRRQHRDQKDRARQNDVPISRLRLRVFFEERDPSVVTGRGRGWANTGTPPGA